ncbi:MAG: hypothetical protein EP317_04320 [Bacillota bacterium]|nr:MAG: hypothetical protein EP317_04320 [Bacillota bacterium]
MKNKIFRVFNLTFSSFIISQMGGKKLESVQTEDQYRHKLILNALKSSYSFHTDMKSLTLYVGHQNQYCVIFEVTKKKPSDLFDSSTAIFWLKDNEISMVNLDWVELWHLKKDYMDLMEHYKEKIDYSHQIDAFLEELSDVMDERV